VKKIILASAADWHAWADERCIPEPNSGCHLWLGSLNDNGRPTASVGGTSGNAFRLFWQGVNGPIPDGLYLCHRCDNTSCINLAHGFLGTAEDNARDCARKGRQWLQKRSGFENPNAKLTPEMIAYAERVYIPHDRQFGLTALSRRFGIGRNMIAAALAGRSFKDRAIAAAEASAS
jgi:hypothetical protein